MPLSAFITLFVLLSPTMVMAQGQPNITPDIKKIFPDTSSFKKFDYLNKKIYRLSNPLLPSDTARFSHETELGLVYRLPQSNMPLLLPNHYHPVMPGTNSIYSQPQYQNPIPNPLVPGTLYFEKPGNKK